MSNSWNCEAKLRELASELYSKATELELAANVLRDLRDEGEINTRIEDAKKWAKEWMR